MLSQCARGPGFDSWLKLDFPPPVTFFEFYTGTFESQREITQFYNPISFIFRILYYTSSIGQLKCFEITIITLQFKFFFFFCIYISWLPLSYIYSSSLLHSFNKRTFHSCQMHIIYYSTMHFGYFSWIIRLCLMLWQILFCKQHLRKPYQWMLYGWIFWL